MKIITSKALILNKKEISGNSFLIILFTREFGKISSISYGMKNSKKRDKASIVPLSISDVEINVKNGMNILETSILDTLFKNIYKNLSKINISMYILDTVNKILEENQKEEDLFDKIVEILKYIDSFPEDKIDEDNQIYNIIIAFLRRIMIEIGIFSHEEFLNNKDYRIFIKETRKLIKIEKEIYENLISFFETYINRYYDININYKKYIF